MILTRILFPASTDDEFVPIVPRDVDSFADGAGAMPQLSLSANAVHTRAKRGILDVITDVASSVGRGISNVMHMGGR